jgi:tetratricopeptide (TPR) repeat protein
MKTVLILFTLLITPLASANVDLAWKSLISRKGAVDTYPMVVDNLIKEGLYFTSLPYIKEYLTVHKGKYDQKMDYLIDEVATHVGVKQFEVMPSKFLARSNSPMIKYILAKKLFRVGKYSQVLQTLNAAIPNNHPAKPYALLLEGSSFSILKKYKSAISSFKTCVDKSESEMTRQSDVNRKRQLAINRDYCVVGIARSQFANGDYEEANLSYLDLQKASHIWPEILFEEAWNSFYLRDYNRTLGKLVTYKAPVLQYIFNPEVEILRALTYMELCLWEDTKKVVDNFYGKYQKNYNQVIRFLKKHGKDYKYFYLMAKSYKNGKKPGNELLKNMVDFATKDPAFLELYDNFHSGRKELEFVKKMRNKNFARVLNINLKESMLLHRNLIGAYVRKSMHMMVRQVDKTMQDMSYIKLEVIRFKKRELYQLANNTRSRGDIRNLQRTDKQYFWDFNGEFWADELGDYVFTLKSECK